MLFNSYSFLFAYLPLTLLGFFSLARVSRLYAAAWLAAASIFFYGWWDIRYVPLLLGSIFFNYLIGYTLTTKARYASEIARKVLLSIGIIGDLLLLGYYKYADFFIQTFNQGFDHQVGLLNIILPLGISFFTFTQIAFLVDTFYGKVSECRFIHYCLFVTYFPHLIAGPVLHHGEMMPQFGKKEIYSPQSINFAVGMTIFFIGLFKKVVLADGIAPYGNSVFNMASREEPLELFQAWGGALAYTLQLYFDFSGYSDMAIGLSRIFGIKLPLNFHSPYKATNIIEFWRRWHMTLSRFLRDYLYIPLGGNRKGPIRRHFNLFITMLLGGFWHGAGWTFVIWGGLHGFYLIINHAWRNFRQSLGQDITQSTFLGRIAAGSLTFLAVVVAWVIFRAQDIDAGWRILYAMAGGNGVSLPAAFTLLLGPLGPLLKNVGVAFTLGGGEQFFMTYAWVGSLLGIAFLLPNTQQLMMHFEPALNFVSDRQASLRWNWRYLVWMPTIMWSIGVAFIAIAGLLSLSHPTEFLYFQF